MELYDKKVTFGITVYIFDTTYWNVLFLGKVYFYRLEYWIS